MSTAINWPATLPYFTRDSWAYQNIPNIASTDMEIGEPKTRLRETTSMDRVSGTLQLDSTQVSTLVTFLETTIAKGTLSFNFPDYLRSSTREMWLDIQKGQPLYEVRQTSKYTFEVDLTFRTVKA